MKKLFTLWSLLLCFVAGAWAQDTEVTFVLNDPAEIEALGIALPEAGKGTTVDNMSKDGVNILATSGTTPTRIYQGSGTNAGKYDFRIYNGGTLAINAGNIINYVKKVEFAGTNLTNLSAKGYSDGVWTGCSMEPLFTATGTATITSIKVTYGDPPALLPPSISGITPFIGSTTVSINAEAGTEIRYSTDGSDPTSGYSYTEPFTINETTTVKAIAILLEDVNTKSAIATKTFTAIPGYDKLSDVNALANNTVFGYTGEAQVVANVSNKYIYVQDASASSLIYQSAGGLELPTGSTIAANWNAKVSIYNKLFEIVPTSELSTKGSIVPVTYPMAHAEDVTADNINQVMKFKGVTFTKGEGKNLTIDGTVVGYNQFNITIPDPDAEKTYDIVGAVGRYNDNIQFWPISITSSPEDIVVAPAEGSNIYMEVETAKAGKNVKDIYVYLEPGKKYTISQPIQAPAAFVIMGAAPGTDPSTIDGSTAMAEIDATNLSTATDPTNLTGPVVQMSETPAVEPDDNGFYPLSDVGFINVKITNLKGQLFYANQIKYLINDFHIDYCNIQMAGGSKSLIDIDRGGIIAHFDISKNTIYSNPAHTGFFFTSNSAATASQAGLEKIEFEFSRNTIYNIAYGKNFCNPREKGKAFLKFMINNNVFVNCGKSNNQVIVGFNGGQTSATPDWTVGGNVFNYDGADTHEGEISKAGQKNGADIVTNCLAGIFAFTDAANGDFNGVFKGEATSAPAKYPGDPRWTYTYQIAPVDVVVNAEDIAATADNITAAIAAKAAGRPVKDLTVNLAAGTAYRAEDTITAGGNIVINGEGATIDCTRPETGLIFVNPDFITLDGTDVFAKKADGTDSDHKLIASVEINNVKLTGLDGALITDAQKTLLEKLTINNAVIEMPAAQKNVINFNGKGYVGEVVVKNSTIYANGHNTGFFAQYGSRPKNVNGEWLQQFDVQNSTFVGIAYGKNICDVKQNGTAQNVYTLKNNVFVDCGKSAQVVVGFNKGQTSATPVWDVDGNIFNYDGEDKCAAEVEKAGQKNEEDIVKNSVAGVVTFTNAANGDFNGTFALAEGATEPTTKPGDPRWTLTYQPYVPSAINGIEATAEDANAPMYNLAGQKVTKSYKGVVIQSGKKYVNK